MRLSNSLSFLIFALPLADARAGNDEAPLFRPQSPPIPTAEGKIALGDRRGGEQFEIETRGFDVVAASFHVFLEDAQQVFQDLGALSPRGGSGDQGELVFDTSRGGSLPFSATLAELAGRRVEVRDAGANVVLFGAVPTFGQSRRTINANVRMRATGEGRSVDARGRIRTQFKPSKMRYRLDVSVWAKTAERDLTLWIENPATNQLEQVDSAVWRGSGTKRASFRWRSDRSQRLPFGLVDPTQLDGMRVEIRDESDRALLRGTL